MAFKSTYDATNELRESLLEILRDISPNEDNYFISNLAKGASAMQTLHQWNLFYEPRATATSVKAEGAETTYPDLPYEGRSSNYTMILDSPLKLSRTKASIAEVSGEDALGVEKERALRRLKSNMEYAIVNGAVAAGATGTGREAAGLLACITTNVTAYASSAVMQSFTEQIFNDMEQVSWDKVGGSYVADTFVGPVVLKRRVAAFGTNLTRTQPASEKRLTKEVRVYDTEVGPTVTVLAHKDMPHGALTTAGVLLNESLFELAFLVKSGEPHYEERAKTGDNVPGVYLTEFTLVSLDERASVKFTGFQPNL